MVLASSRVGATLLLRPRSGAPAMMAREAPLHPLTLLPLGLGHPRHWRGPLACLSDSEGTLRKCSCSAIIRLCHTDDRADIAEYSHQSAFGGGRGGGGG